MSWETTAKATIRFNRQTYNTLDEVDERLTEVREDLAALREKILILMAGDPRQLLNTLDCEGYQMDPIDVVHTRANEMLEYYRELSTEEYKLVLLIENFDTREGDFVLPPGPKTDPAQTEIDFDQPLS